MNTTQKVIFILADALNPNVGGVQRVTCNLGPQFVSSGLAVAYFSFTTTGHVPIEQGTLFYAPKNGSENTPENLQYLMEVLEKWRPDIVINQMPYIAKIWPLLSQARDKIGFSLLGCLHNSLFSVVNNVREASMRALPRPLFMLLDNRIGLKILLILHRIKHAKALRGILAVHDRFLLLTVPNKEELKYFIGEYPEEKVLVIPNSINLEKITPAPKEKIVLHVGRLNDSQKRSDLLLEVWKKCYAEMEDWEFFIVGDGPYKAQLEAEIEQENIPRVYLEGYQKPDDYFARAALFVMPSAFEGFPNTILEAQSYGCVVLAFNSYPAVEWIVNDQKDALLSTPFNTDQMADQVLEMARSVDKRAAFQAAARINATQFSLPTIIEKWLKLFNSLKK
jgi:glycosyltransferase involved in cell wall biosynthesis